MKVSVEITHNLRILGLSPGATPSEVRSAFRRLARTCHPDIAGRQSARRFEQITNAYTFLKNLPQDEVAQSETPGAAAPKTARRRPERGLDWKWKIPFFRRLKIWSLKTWSLKGQESLEAERERSRRAAEEAEKKLRRARSDRVDAVLARAEGAADVLLKRLKREAHSCDAKHLALRLRSDRLRVRHLALSRVGPAANQSEILDAVLDLLRKRDIDEKTARLVSALPLSPENRRKLADALAGRASCMPDFLMGYLLDLYGAQKTDQKIDRTLMELYLQNANPGGAGFLLRHWPKGSTAVSAAVLHNLLSREDECVLVPLLNMMKRHSFPCSPRSLERLKTLSVHPSTAVRVWAKTLLSQNLK
ncbi:MAG: DnaJ domain-containing protein [Synergistaceae bacterium]|jgi:curved DNA-binding protein CbpA|nr:DnaJ domain-containing protein [Synergistaceae bacterium]